MSEWADHATEGAQQDIWQLISAAATVVFNSFRKMEPFTPFAVTMHHDGEIHLKLTVPGEPTEWGYVTSTRDEDAREEVSLLRKLLISQAQSLRAAAILERCGDDAVPVMWLVGHHRESPPFAAGIKWLRGLNGKLTLSPEVHMEPGPFALFTISAAPPAAHKRHWWRGR